MMKKVMLVRKEQIRKTKQIKAKKIVQCVASTFYAFIVTHKE